MPDLEVRGRSVGPWPMNSYVLVCPETKASALIDPGADSEALLELLAGTQPAYILLTHTHPDHVGILAEMRSRLNVPLLAHPGPHFNDLDLGTYTTLADGEQFSLGNSRLTARYAPGHIDDMICFEIVGQPNIIVGDTVFAGGPGRTRSPEAFQTTLQTLRNVVLSWPDAARCYPGHGPTFLVGEVRAQIEAFLARDHGDFSGDASW
jgi:glyoxylase-like metal-dependent hydrolase (beta-lactamase superfamily II)